MLRLGESHRRSQLLLRPDPAPVLRGGRLNDLTVKMGHFATFTSLEVVPAPLNFFYSHSYLMCGYYDPLLVTGLQADYKLTGNWTVSGGFNRGWQLFENPHDTLNFLGGVKWASDDKRSALSVMVDSGPTQTFTGFHDQTSVFTVFTQQFSERFWVGSQMTVGTEADGSALTPGKDDAWYGMEQILTYKLNPKWSAGLRYEWVQDNQGSRVAGIGNVLGTDKGWLGAPRFRRRVQRSEPRAELPSHAEPHARSGNPLGLVRRSAESGRPASLRRLRPSHPVHDRDGPDRHVLTAEASADCADFID